MRPITRFLPLFVPASLCALLVISAVRGGDQIIEARFPATMPEITSGSLLNPKFYAQVDDYLRDDLAFRNIGVHANARIEIGVFDQSPNPNVALGRNGWLFLTTGFSYDDTCRSELDLWKTQLIEKFASSLHALADSGKSSMFLFAPEKNIIYPELVRERSALFRCAQEEYPRLVSFFQERMGQHFFDTTPELQMMRAAGQEVYLATDTHWKSFAGTMVLLTALERLTRNSIVGTPLPGEFFALDGTDLSRLIGLPVNESNYKVAGHAAIFKMIPVPGTHPIMVFVSDDPRAIAGTTLVVIDSYLLDAREAVSPYFKRVVFIHWDAMDYMMSHGEELEIEQLFAKADRIVFESAQRFMFARIGWLVGQLKLGLLYRQDRSR